MGKSNLSSRGIIMQPLCINRRFKREKGHGLTSPIDGRPIPIDVHRYGHCDSRHPRDHLRADVCATRHGFQQSPPKRRQVQLQCGPALCHSKRQVSTGDRVRHVSGAVHAVKPRNSARFCSDAPSQPHQRVCVVVCAVALSQGVFWAAELLQKHTTCYSS